jgi:putative endonuclease
MAACYILYSHKIEKFYIGATHEDVDARIEKHNKNTYGNHRFTATTDDWELFLLIPTNNYQMAIRIERKIKSMKSAEYIRNLKKYPEMIQKLIST